MKNNSNRFENIIIFFEKIFSKNKILIDIFKIKKINIKKYFIIIIKFKKLNNILFLIFSIII